MRIAYSSRSGSSPGAHPDAARACCRPADGRHGCRASGTGERAGKAFRAQAARALPRAAIPREAPIGAPPSRARPALAAWGDVRRNAPIGPSSIAFAQGTRVPARLAYGALVARAPRAGWRAGWGADGSGSMQGPACAPIGPPWPAFAQGPGVPARLAYGSHVARAPRAGWRAGWGADGTGSLQGLACAPVVPGPAARTAPSPKDLCR